MIDWKKHERSRDAVLQTVKTLMRMSVDKFHNQPEHIRVHIFRPHNIFYIQKIAQEKRGIYKVHLDAPVERRNEETVKSYKITADSLNAVKDSLSDDFKILSQDLICSINRIRKVDKALETVTIRRISLSKCLRVKFGLKREEKLRAGRGYIRSLKNAYYEDYWIKFSKNSLVDESQKDLWGNESGNSIYFNPMDIACIESTGGIKTLQLKSINAGRSKYPIYQFRDRKGLIKILRGNFFGEEGISEIFIQINSDCFANIYCLMAPNSRLLGETLSLFICATKSIELEVGKTYIDQLNEILNGCQKIN